jgi:hypothetical protein
VASAITTGMYYLIFSTISTTGQRNNSTIYLPIAARWKATVATYRCLRRGDLSTPLICLGECRNTRNVVKSCSGRYRNMVPGLVQLSKPSILSESYLNPHSRLITYPLSIHRFLSKHLSLLYCLCHLPRVPQALNESVRVRSKFEGP